MKKYAEAHDCWKDYQSGSLSKREYEECLKRFEDSPHSYGYTPRSKSRMEIYLEEFAEYVLLSEGVNTFDAKFLRSVQSQYHRGLSPKQKAVVTKLQKKWKRSIGDTYGSMTRALANLKAKIEIEREAQRARDEATAAAVFVRSIPSKYKRDWQYESGSRFDMPDHHFWERAPDDNGNYIKCEYEAAMDWKTKVYHESSVEAKFSLYENGRYKRKVQLRVSTSNLAEDIPKIGDALYVEEFASSGSSNDEKIEILETLLARNPGNRFLESIKSQLERGRTLSDKQLKAIRQMLYKNRMRGEADMFRTANNNAERIKILGMASANREIIRSLMVANEVEADEKEAKKKKNKGRGSKPTTKPEEEKRKNKNKIKVKIDPSKSKDKNPFADTEKHRRNDGAHKNKKKYDRKDKSWKQAAVQSVMRKVLAGDVIDFMEYKRRREDPGLAKAIKELQAWQKKNNLKVSDPAEFSSSADIQAAYSHGEWVLQKREEDAHKGKKQFTPMLEPGEGFIDEKNKLQIHMYASSLNVIDLQDAGRRGKVVTTHILTYMYGFGDWADETAVNLFSNLEYDLQMRDADISEIAKTMQMIGKAEGFGYQSRKDKAVRYDPVTTKPIKFNTNPVGKAIVSWEATTKKFTINHYNRPYKDGGQQTMFVGKGRDAKAFYAWLDSNVEQAKRMDLKDIRKVLNDLRIKFRTYYPS